MADKKAETKKETKAVVKDAGSAAPKAAAKTAVKGKKIISGKAVKVTQIGSPIGRQKYQQQTLIGLGLNKMHRSRVLEDTPCVRGMIEAVKHLLKVEDAA